MFQDELNRVAVPARGVQRDRTELIEPPPSMSKFLQRRQAGLRVGASVRRGRPGSGPSLRQHARRHSGGQQLADRYQHLALVVR